MRISALTRFSAGMLLLAVIGMTASVFWGLGKLKEPFKLNESYSVIVQQVSVKTRLLINDYLLTGDAAVLQKAQGFLAGELRDSVAQLPEALQQALLPEIATLEESLEVDLRAAGKLAGDIQGLLLQNERELIASLESLQDYINEAASSAPPEQVWNLEQAAFNMTNLNGKRAVLRSSYFSAPSLQLKESLEKISDEITDAAEQLNQLPLLGVLAEQEDDDFSAMMGLDSDEEEQAIEAEDIGDQITDDIVYLSRRYLPELQQTAHQVELGESAKRRVEELTAALEARVLDSKRYIDQSREESENLVITFLILFLVLLFVAGMVSTILQFRVLSGMRTVSAYIRKLSGGDFSEGLDDTMEFRELHDLASCANQLQSYLYQLVSEIHQEVGKVKMVSGAIEELAEEIHTGTAEQSARTDDVTLAIDELLQSFQFVAGHAIEASSSANEGQSSMRQSAEVMQNLEGSIGAFATEVEQGVFRIQRLQDDAHNIEKVLNAIVAIARQTNLLALNAAVEAASAGEHGRGFAVVAGEVRQLAGRTSEATAEIRGMIDELRCSSDLVAETMKRQQQQAECSVAHSQRAGEALRLVMQSIDRINDMNAKITTATEKQSSSVDSVQQCVADVQSRTRDAAERSVQARGQSERLSEVSLGLFKLVQRYTI